MQHQQRQHPVEAGLWEGHRTGVTHLESEMWIAGPTPRIVYVVCGDIKPADPAGGRPAGEREGQAAGAAAKIEDAFRADRADEVEEGLCEPLAPAPHLLLVGIAVGGREGRHHWSPRCRT